MIIKTTSNNVPSLVFGIAAFCSTLILFPNTVAAQNNHIKIEISQSFDWSGDSIRKLASGTAAVFSDRCSRPCTISLRITMDRSLKGGLKKRLAWLRDAMIKEMNKKTGQQVSIEDSIVMI